MDTDFQPLIENQAKLAAKAQSMALVELNPANSELVETHLNLLFDLCEMTVIDFYDDDEGEDESSKTPTPTPEDSKRY